jgi:hypothetical protein
VCLHNGWKRASEDDSSKSTSSSVFDFNGDGAAEVVYNDECVLRIYEGRTGELLTWHESLSRTVVENPVVADVDNDGNAEIITIMNTETMQCGSDNIDGVPGAEIDRDNADTGIRVWGDPADTWVSARRIWNQQSYHVTNVTEAGGIPLRQPESWLEYNGRYYNTYRSQPRSEGVAPDLTVSGIGVSLPGAGCGDGLATLVDIAFEGPTSLACVRPFVPWASAWPSPATRCWWSTPSTVPPRRRSSLKARAFPTTPLAAS